MLRMWKSFSLRHGCEWSRKKSEEKKKWNETYTTKTTSAHKLIHSFVAHGAHTRRHKQWLISNKMPRLLAQNQRSNSTEEYGNEGTRQWRWRLGRQTQQQQQQQQKHVLYFLFEAFFGTCEKHKLCATQMFASNNVQRPPFPAASSAPSMPSAEQRRRCQI